jgi:hypothetical protein
MITRRFIAQAKAQNWFAAGLEILIVVVGVFLGIEASNWNQERTDRERGRAFLARIDADLASDVDGFDRALVFWKRVSDYGTTALRFAETGSAADKTPWQLVLAFFQASQNGDFITSQSTFDEMRSAGQMALIPSVDLRKAISNYYSTAGNRVLSENPPYRQHARSLIPNDAQTHLWTNCFRMHAGGAQELFDCDSPVPQERAAEIAQMLRQDAALIGELRYWLSTLQVAAIIAHTRQDDARRIRHLISEALSKP